MKEFGFPWTKVNGVKTDGAPSRTGKETGSIDRIWREMGKKNQNFTFNFTGSSNKSHFVERL
jgi:hypothetical protein